MKTSKNKYRNKISEWDQQVTLNPMPDDISEEMLDEKLFGNQKFIAKQAEPKNKITAADLKKLRDRKKTDVDEGNAFTGALAKAKEKGKDSFEVGGKKFDVKEGLYDVEDINPDNEFDYVEEDEFVDVDELLQEIENELRINEGNAFGWALKNARDKGESSFELNGKTYEVSEGKSKKSKKDNKWIQDAIKKPGALRKKMGVEKDEDIPAEKLKSKSKELKKKAEGDKKLSKSDLKTSKQVNLALNLKKMNESKLYLSEDEMVDLIEKLVREERVKGLDVTNKNLKASKKENDDYIKSVSAKMKDYLKDGSKGEYTENPENFPLGNGQIEKMNKKAYTQSEEVDEYIEDFAYPGQTNLVFDEIKPDDERIEKYLKGNKTTGNAEIDEDGKAYGNVVPSKTGERFMKNYKKNAYGQEQMNASYKRYPQDTIEVSGENTKSKRKESALSKLSEAEIEKNQLIKEEFEKIQRLMGYNKKTQ